MSELDDSRWFEENWPPPTYFTTGTYGPVPRERLTAVTPLGGVQRKPDGSRFVRYQTPEAPLVPGSLRVAGYLRSLSDGSLLNPADKVVGTVDWATGIFEVMVEYDQSPGLGSRVVEYTKAT